MMRAARHMRRNASQGRRRLGKARPGFGSLAQLRGSAHAADDNQESATENDAARHGTHVVLIDHARDELGKANQPEQ
ncbi:hypothetical protein GCM10009087_04890 [Sphingomonas oligophenolica]